MKLFNASSKTYLSTALSKLSDVFFTYALFYFTMFVIFVEFLVVVYFVLLKHCLQQVINFESVMNMVYTSMWIRIGQ